MTAFRPRLRALLVGAAAIALVTIGAGGTLAASTTPTVYACYNAYGQVAMASIAQCKLAGGGQLVQINTQGIQGATGATGPTGATGATGPTGAPGAAGAMVTELLNLPVGAAFVSLGVSANGLDIVGSCATGPTPGLGFHNSSGALALISGAGFPPGFPLTNGVSAVNFFTGTTTMQAATTAGGVGGIVTSFDSGAGCGFYVTH